MTALDELPSVDSFLGIDLKTGSMIVAAISIVHPLSYGCTLFLPISYLLVTIWILVAIYFVFSIILFWGTFKDSPMYLSTWIWYASIFVVLMLMMMILLAVLYTSRRQKARVFIVVLAMIWYIFKIYLILVVNSHRKNLEGSKHNV